MFKSEIFDGVTRSMMGPTYHHPRISSRSSNYIRRTSRTDSHLAESQGDSLGTRAPPTNPNRIVSSQSR